MRPGAEADDSYGVIEFGSCGFTHSDGTLAYPKDMYAALAGRCRAGGGWQAAWAGVLHVSIQHCRASSRCSQATGVDEGACRQHVRATPRGRGAAS
jgi:hypothetical protein